MSRNRIYPKSFLGLDPVSVIIDDLYMHTITNKVVTMKYCFTGERDHNGLGRIRRIKDGLVGGWIMSERNLSQHGDCFVYDNAKVFGSTYIAESAMVAEDAIVSGAINIRGRVLIKGNACLSGVFNMAGNDVIKGNAHIHSLEQLLDYIALQGTVDEENKPEVLSLQELF